MKADEVGSTVKYDTSHAWRYMYSASDASKRRSLSISILMVLSALGPISAVVADHDEGDDWEEDGPYIELWMELGGSWEVLDPYEMTEVEDGTYEMQIEYIDLDVGSNYTLSWSMYGINEDWGELVGNVTSGNVTDTWQMEVSEFDCRFNVNVAIINNTDGQWDNIRSNNYEFHGECMEYGTITYSADIGGNWVSEPDEMDAGSYDMSWDVTNLTTGDEYKLDYWYYLSGNRINFEQDMHGSGHEWVATGATESIDWNVTISDTDCSMQPESMLWQNTSSGWTIVDQYWVGQLSEVVLLPCEQMLTLSWYDNASGSWEELDNWAGSSWQNAVIYEGDDSCDDTGDEDGEVWECTDDDGNTETWDACNESDGEYWCWNWHEPLFLEPGDHQFQLALSYLETGGSYMLNTHRSIVDYFAGESHEDDYLEFNAPSDTLTLNETVTIDAGDCGGSLRAFLDQNVTDSSGAWSHHPISDGYWEIEMPCEEPPSPFTLTYDGVEWEPEHEYWAYDECEDIDDDGGSYDCWMDEWDEDDDGEPEWSDWHQECEEDANGTWWCLSSWGQDPHLDEGNHTMELTIEGLDVGDNYSVEIKVDHCRNMVGCDYDSSIIDFTATAETMSETFYLETDNYTCNVGIFVGLSEIHDEGWSQHIYGQSFGFNGPCEQHPSPFTLYVDGVEWEPEWHYNNYDECEEDEEGYECWNNNWDWNGDGEPDHFDWHEECEEDASGAWECIVGMNIPSIDPGNHTMELEIEGLESGESYFVEGGVFIWSQDDNDEEWFGMNLTATSDTMSETFYVETDEFTCHVSIDVMLAHYYDSENWTWIGADNFYFGGPCEEPPSPFTLTYDGAEWEQEYEYWSYDECEENDGGYECWMDDWDEDGDDEPDHWDWNEDCEEDAEGTWWCQSSWGNNPHLDAGNHTMDVTIEDVEGWFGPGEYELRISANWWESMGGGDSIEFSFTFNASSANHTETFHVETYNSSCGIDIRAELLHIEHDNESGNTWHNYVDSEHWGFDSPCEQPPSNIGLTYEVDGVMVDWEMEESWIEFDECEEHEEGYECWMDDWDEDGDDEPDHWDWNEDCEEDADGTWWCIVDESPPEVGEGDLDMTFEIGELDSGEQYRLDWSVYIMSPLSWEWNENVENFTASSDEHSVGFTQWVDNSTCGVSVSAWLQVGEDHDGDGIVDHWDWRDQNSFEFRGPCQIDFPVDISLQILDDGTWEDVEGMDLDIFFAADEEDEDPSVDEVIDWIGYYVDEDGNYELNLTLDGLEVGDNYTMWVFTDTPGSVTFVCGNGEEIPFDLANDGEEDCDDGSDEPQYDENGDPINWFDCWDGSEIPFDWVNDGEDDCDDGEDEGWGSEEEEELSFTASSDVMHEEMDIDFEDETCLGMIRVELYDDDGPMLGMYMTLIAGPAASHDHDGNGAPDCIEWLIEDEDGPEDPDGGDWSIEDFYVGEDFVLELVDVDADNGTAMVFIASHTTLDDDFRMKLDYDFFNGDGVLNETEAAMFIANMQAGWGDDSDECSDEAPPFSLNGVDSWCAVSHLWIEDLANNSDGLSPVMINGWDLHYNASADDSGQITLSFPGFPASEGAYAFNGTMCGGAAPESGYVPVTWSYDNVTQTSLCVDTTAGGSFAAIEVVFGQPDTDGDGYNDFDDRFPDDPNEWNDTDDDGVGDNADDFPNNANEWNDADGDGVGDNGDAFPWDPTETADTDGDGWGDNADEFPNDPTEWVDTDGDGTGDNADTDADGDGTSDSDEDSDGDGVNDDEDDFPFDANETTDTDGDGVGDNADEFPEDANETTDTDGDGVGDNSDEDADGDGTPNDLDDFPLSDSESTDTDGDGVGDNEDAFPNNPNEYIDSDGDGVGDNADTDDDDDGTPDVSDAFPLDASEDTDTDMDGVGDNADEFDNDNGEWSDTDGDGVGDNSDAFPADPNEQTDSDGDGVGDNTDAFPNDPNEIVDSDGDGVGNTADAFPYNENEQQDTDGDGIGDNADDDADGDGVPDDPSTPDPEEGGDDGGILPGFTAATGLVSILGAAILIAGRRKD